MGILDTLLQNVVVGTQQVHGPSYQGLIDLCIDLDEVGRCELELQIELCQAIAQRVAAGVQRGHRIQPAGLKVETH